MVAMVLLLAYDWLRTRKLPQMHLVSAVLVWVFGAATLLLQDVRFIQWKATVFYWMVAAGRWQAASGSARCTLLERLLGKNLPEGVHGVRRALAQFIAGVRRRFTWRSARLTSGSPSR